MANKNSTRGLKFYNLSARWGHGIPQWPSAPGINVLTLQFHALDGVYVTEFEGIMHRGTHMDAPLHVKIWSWVPGVVLLLGTSRHLPAPTAWTAPLLPLLEPPKADKAALKEGLGW